MRTIDVTCVLRLNWSINKQIGWASPSHQENNWVSNEENYDFILLYRYACVF